MKLLMIILKGFNNYAAPGADRLRISVSLFKKALDDFDDNNFILLANSNQWCSSN